MPCRGWAESDLEHLAHLDEERVSQKMIEIRYNGKLVRTVASIELLLNELKGQSYELIVDGITTLDVTDAETGFLWKYELREYDED